MKQVASIAVVGSRGSILFIRRRDNGKWSLPGGHIEEGEEPLAAAVRELYEEVGLEIDPDDLDYLGCGTIKDKYKVYSYKYENDDISSSDIDFSNDPDEEADDHCWFGGDTDSDYDDGCMPENVHVPNERNVTLILMGKSTNGGDVTIEEELSKMAVKDIPPGEPDGSRFDYNHLLAPTQRGKLSLIVKHYPQVGPTGGHTHAMLFSHEGGKRIPIGKVEGIHGIDRKTGEAYIEPHSELDEDYHGLGLGKAMYEALYAHAYHKLGIRKVMGGIHSADAHRVHESLARKHGFEYLPKDRSWNESMPHGQYGYTLKNEDLSKGIMGAVAGAALAMSPGLKAGFDKVNPPAPKVQQVNTTTTPVSEQAQFKQTVEAAIPKWTPEGLHPWLIPIAHLESSFGKNMNHAPNTKGEYHTAHGPVGFKPSTAHEEWKKTKKLQEAFPGLEDPADFTKAFKTNWKLYNLLASSHFLRLAHRHGSNEKAAYAWRWGTGVASGAQDDVVNKDNYVMRYRDLLASTGVQKPVAKAEPNHKPWVMSNGVKIPKTGTPERKTWNKAHFDTVVKYFARGDKTKVRKVKVPVSEHIAGHFINTKGAVGPGGRNNAPSYLKMLRGGDSVPPLVVRRNGISWHVVDGNARLHAALQHGKLAELDAYELL